jgi:hypothetical protein
VGLKVQLISGKNADPGTDPDNHQEGQINLAGSIMELRIDEATIPKIVATVNAPKPAINANVWLGWGRKGGVTCEAKALCC